MSEEKQEEGAKPVLVLNQATGKGTFEETKILRLQQCPSISYITSKDGAKLAKLVEMELTSLEELIGIFEPLENTDTDIGNFFEKVAKIAVTSCHKIKYVIPNDILQMVDKKLEVIIVRKCKMVECIFHPHANSLASLSVLRSIEIDELESLNFIWRQGIPPQVIFENLKEFFVRKCNQLTFLFTTHVAVQLKNLQKLTIEDNSGLTEIISADGTATPSSVQVFKSVTHLSLQELPILKHFNSNEVNFDWPHLVKLNLGACPALERLPISPNGAPRMSIIDLASSYDFKWYNKLVNQANHLERFEIWLNNEKHVP